RLGSQRSRRLPTLGWSERGPATWTRRHRGHVGRWNVWRRRWRRRRQLCLAANRSWFDVASAACGSRRRRRCVECESGHQRHRRHRRHAVGQPDVHPGRAGRRQRLRRGRRFENRRRPSSRRPRRRLAGRRLRRQPRHRRWRRHAGPVRQPELARRWPRRLRRRLRWRRRRFSQRIGWW
uniref:Alkaline phosphatase n=1 Tax=Macrostomum lignano TaxID=282301 RepID=A0A1I8GET9_9PLAT